MQTPNVQALQGDGKGMRGSGEARASSARERGDKAEPGSGSTEHSSAIEGGGKGAPGGDPSDGPP